MKGEAFITRPMSLWLDLVRGLAALAVVVGHAFRLDLYTGPLVVSRALEKNAVVVFFVLSGLVIASSVDKRRDTLSSYVIARASRIVPVTLGATLVALGVGALDAHLARPPLFSEHAGWADPVEVLQALTYLSESYNSTFPLNPAHWSLCYEVWFYAIFATATYLRGRSRAIWLALLAIMAGPNVLLLLPAWLMGVWVARRGADRDISPSRARVFVAAGLASLFVLPQFAPAVLEYFRLIIPWNPGYSLYAPTDTVLAAGIAVGFVGLRVLSARGLVLPAVSEKPVRFLANCSFSLYLLHWPLLKLAKMMGIAAGTNIFAFAAIIAVVVAIAAAFAAVTEHRRYAVRAMLETMFLRKRTAPLTA